MGTPKRERQKANRLQRQLEQERAERTGTMRRTALRVGVIALIALAGVVIIAWVGGAFSDDDDTADDSTADDVATDDLTADLTDVTTAPTDPPPPPPDKPDVAIPSELPDELTVTTLTEGSGPEAATGDLVSVYYVGVRSEDGAEFDANYDGTQPITVELGVGTVIEGWEQGLLGVQEGGRYQLDIPAELAYGDAPRGDVIQAGDALTFVVDVVAVEPGEV